MSPDSFLPRNRLRLAALVVLVAGLVAGAIVYVAAAPDGSDTGNVQIINGQAYPVDSSREMQQLERLGGKASVQTFRFQQWFDGLWQGRELAYTLVVVSAAIAWLCWHLAGLMDETV